MKIVCPFLLRMQEVGLPGERLLGPTKTERYIQHYQVYLETSKSMQTEDESFTDFLVLQLFGLGLAFGVLVVEILHKKLTKKFVKWVRSSYGDLQGKLNRLKIRRRIFKSIKIVRPASEGIGATTTPIPERLHSRKLVSTVTSPHKTPKSVAKTDA